MADINDRVALLEAEVRVLAARFYALPEIQKQLKTEAEEAERVRKAQTKDAEEAEKEALHFPAQQKRTAKEAVAEEKAHAKAEHRGR